MEKFWWVNEESKGMLSSGYLLPNQTVEQKLEKICKHNANVGGTPDKWKDFYDVFAYGWASLSSPIWANHGEERGLPISCFGTHVSDDLFEIYRGLTEVAMQTKAGGGTSGYFDLRPKGSAVSGGAVTSGLMSFLKDYDTTVTNVAQNGVRRGAFAAYIDAEHDEFYDFISIKDKKSPLQKLNTGVRFRKSFMDKVKAKDPEALKRILAFHVSRSEKGFPYAFFDENVNENKPQVYKDKGIDIRHSNLCVSGDTQILTDKGYELIGDIVGENVNVWNGQEFTETLVVKTGENQKLVRVITNSGYELDCTEYHKFYIQKGFSRSPITEKRANELQKGDRLIKFELPVIEGELDLEFAYDNGFYSGDGCLASGTKIVYLYGEKKSLLPFLGSVYSWNNNQSTDRIIGRTKGLKDKFFVPDANYSVKSRLDWLAGYLDADGTVTNVNGSQTLQVASVEPNFLREVQLMLQTLGCDSKITHARDAGKFMLPKNDGTGESKMYDCKEISRLLINGNSLYKLSNLGLKCNRLKWEVRKPNRECSQFIQVKEVVELEGLHDTYCFTEKKRGMGMFNGVLTGQCSEIMLESNQDESFVCCLLSMNLYLYDEWKDTNAVELMIEFLDNVITDFIEKGKKVKGIERAVKFAENQRALGLGVLGYHSYLQKKRVPFDSLVAHFVNKEIFKDISQKANNATIELAKAKGEAPILKGYGRRNVTTMAIAPTTSSSSILGQMSMGIEPFVSNLYTFEGAKGSFKRFNRELSLLLEEKGKLNDDVIESVAAKGGSVKHLDFLTDEEKAVFATAWEISPETIIRQAAQRQKFIDQSQSLNLFIPIGVDIKEMHRLFMLAYELGVKTLYYQRGQSMAKEELLAMMECKSCEA